MNEIHCCKCGNTDLSIIKMPLSIPIICYNCHIDDTDNFYITITVDKEQLESYIEKGFYLYLNKETYNYYWSSQVDNENIWLTNAEYFSSIGIENSEEQIKTRFYLGKDLYERILQHEISKDLCSS